MSSPPLGFKTYHCTRHTWGRFGAFHGEYDGLSTGLYAHEHLQILVPLKGRIHLALGDEALWLGPERAVALLPGTVHAASTLGGAFEFLALNASPSWLQALGTELNVLTPTGTAAIVMGDAGVWLQAKQLALALDAPGLGLERQLQIGVESLGIYLLRAISSQHRPPERPVELERAVAILLARYAENASIAELAAELAISPRHLERRFKAVLGVSPRRFLIDIRLAAARELLSDTDLAVEAIATRVGFGDITHFTRTFRQLNGMPPGAYRRLRRSQASGFASEIAGLTLGPAESGDMA